MDPRDFGDLTYSQVFAKIDAHKLSRYNDMYFNVTDIVSNMDDEGVRDALYGRQKGGVSRGKLVEKMMRPYTPSFMLPEIEKASKSKPIEGMSAKTAEGIMRAIERKIVPHDGWLAIHPIWQRILATARQYRAGQ